jgi:hypothetical protein
MFNASIIRKIYDFSVNKWWFSSFLFTISSIWFILLQFFGKQWSFIDEKGVLSQSAIFWTWVLIVVNVVCSVLKTLADKKDTEKKSSGQYILKKLLSNLYNAKLTKLNRYNKGVLEDAAEFDFGGIVSPREQIHTLMESIRNMVSGLSDTEESKIGLGILFYEDNKWNWLDKINIDNDLDIDGIINNHNSTASHIIDDKKLFIFWPDKRVGEKNHEYVPSPCDVQYNNIGSIYCKNISINDDDGKNIIKAILCITTYGNQICSQNDESAKSRFVADIMPEFELRLKVELCLLNMKDKNDQGENESFFKKRKTKKPATRNRTRPLNRK